MFESKGNEILNSKRISIDNFVANLVSKELKTI